MRGRDHLEDLSVYGRIILRWIFRKWDVGGMDWIDMAQDMERWRAFVYALMNLRVSSNAGNFLTNCGPVSYSGRVLLLGVS